MKRTDAQLAIAIYRCIDDPDMSGEYISTEHIVATFSDVPRLQVLQVMTELFLYGALTHTKTEGWVVTLISEDPQPGQPTPENEERLLELPTMVELRRHLLEASRADVEMTPYEKAVLALEAEPIKAKVVNECAYCLEEFADGEIPTLISPPREKGKPNSLLFHGGMPGCYKLANCSAISRGHDIQGRAL